MPIIEPDSESRGVRIAIKAVPGARQNQIVGPLGDRLKIRISAPPQGGKANNAICKLLASKLGLKLKDLQVISGATNPEKVVLVAGINFEDAQNRLINIDGQ